MRKRYLVLGAAVWMLACVSTMSRAETVSSGEPEWAEAETVSGGEPKQMETEVQGQGTETSETPVMEHAEVSAQSASGIYAATSGTCGDNVTWEYADGVLTISGSGEMENYSYSNSAPSAPWYSFRSEIESIVINSGVTSIGYWAFSGCSSLTTVSIPDSVTRIRGCAFEDCNCLITVSIPVGVTSIENFTFLGCSSLTQVNIPVGVTSIASDMFQGCSSLTEVNIPTGVTRIWGGAFSGCSSLTEVNIPASVTSIGDRAFYGCSSLTEVSIPVGVTSIASDMFQGCSSLTEVNIPTGVTRIWGGAFSDCSSLTKVNIPASVTSIGSYTFYFCSSLAEVSIPEGVTSIGSYTFYGCSSLTEVSIPEGVTSIGDSAFYGCSSLTEVSIPEGVTSIGDSAFYFCSSLTEVSIPEGVTSIGSYTFLGCSSLTEVSIPVGLTSIESFTFYFCSSLTEVSITEGVTSIGVSAFFGCSSLTEVSIPEGVTSIGSGAFSGCSSLTEVSIPAGVTSIGDSVFIDCSSLTEVSIPEGVTSIGDSAFEGCSSLTEVSIPVGVTSIGSYAFWYCRSLTTVYYNGTKSEWERISIDSGNECLTNAELHNEAHTLAIKYTDWQGEEVFDSAQKSLFYGEVFEITSPIKPGYTPDIETVSGTMPYADVTVTVTYYEKASKAFGTCGENIAWKLYEDGELVLTGFGAMYDYAGQNAPWHENAADVLSIDMDSRIANVGAHAFEDCVNVTYVELGYSVTSIGSGAFASCGSLKDIVFPDSLTEIGGEAFQGCALTKITFGSAVSSIGENAFAGCAFTQITIGPAIKVIGANAFADCDALIGIYFYGTPPTVGDNAFGSTSAQGKYIYYYSTKGGWSEEITDGKWHGYWAVPYNAIAKQKYDGTNIYIIKATDRYNTPLKNAAVSLGGVSQTTNKDGMAYFVKPVSAVSLSVSCSDHITYTDNTYTASQSQIMDIIELSDKPSVVQGVSCSGKSIATSVVTLNCNDTNNVSISVQGYSKYTILKYELIQGSRVISTVNTSDRTCRFSVKADKFEEGSNVFVKMYTSDGSTTSSALNIDVIKLANISEAQILNELNSVNIPLDLGALGQVNIPLKFNKASSVISSKVEGRTIRVGINLDVNKAIEQYKKMSSGSMSSYMQKNVDKELASLKKKKSSDAGFDFKICGYIEIEYLGNGQYYVKTNYVKAAVTAKLGFSAEASFFGVVGVYFKASLTGEATLSLKIERFTPESGFGVSDLSFGLEDKLRLEGGGNLLWGVGSAGLYGQAAMGFNIQIVPQTQMQNVYIKGEVGVTWSMLWGLKKGDHKFWDGTIYKWQNRSLYSVQEAYAAALYAAVKDPANYSVNDRSYLEDRTEWLSGRSRVFLAADGGYYDLQSNIYYNVAPKLVTCQGATMMVWLDDNSGRDADNYQTLYYSVYDAGANTWSKPRQLDNNETFDCEFDVYTDGEKIYVIYTEQTDVLSEIGDFDIEDENAIAKLTEGVEVSFAVYENGGFTEPVRITDNDVCEVLPTLASVNGVITAIWNVTDMLTPIETGAEDSVYVSRYVDGVWTAPASVALNQNAISSVAAGVLAGKGVYVYVVDADGNMETAEDLTLVLVDEDGNPAQVDSGIIENVSFGRIDDRDTLIWTAGGSIRYTFAADGAVYDALPDGYSSYAGYKLITTEDGRSLLTFTAVDPSGDKEGTDVYGVYIDADGACGSVIRLLGTDGYVDSYDITVRDGSMIAVFTNSAASFENEKVDTVTDLCYALLEFGADIRLNAVSYDISDIAPGKTVTVSAEIENIGWQDISEISVILYDHDMNPVYEAFVRVLAASGETVEQEIRITLPAALRADSYYVKVLPSCDGVSQDGTRDRNEGDNISELIFAHSDVSVEAEQKIIGGRNYLLLLVRNSGNMPTEAMLSVHAVDDDERLLDELRIENIGAGEEMQFLVELAGLLSEEERLVRCTVAAQEYDPYPVNDSSTLYLLRISSDEYMQAEYDTVENPELSVYSVDYDKYTDTDISVEMTVGGDKFTGIEGLDGGYYTVSGQSVIISGSYLGTLSVGSHPLYFVYDYGQQDMVKRTLTLVVSDTTPIALTGSVAIKGDAIVGGTVFADTDEISPASAKYTCRWELDGVAVGTESTYTIPVDARGKTLKLIVEGCEGYTGALAAEVTADLAKQGAPNLPVVQKVTEKTVTLVADRGVEYSLDGTKWQAGNVFEDLTPGTEYTIYARYAATDTAYAGEMVFVSVVTMSEVIIPEYGFTLKGTVTSFGDNNGVVTVKLLKDSNLVNEIIVTDGQYMFETVESGMYTVKVSKVNHVTRSYAVTLEGEALELNAEIRLKGDINGDGKVDSLDKRMIFGHIAGSTTLTGYEFQVGDVDGSGRIDALDKRMIYGHIAGTSPLW